MLSIRKRNGSEFTKMMADLDIDLLRTFMVVQQLGSFSGAAESLARTQPAVTLQIKRLEARIGGQIIDRSRSREIALTPAGSMLLDYARRILALHDEAQSRLTSPSLKTFVRIGILEELGSHRLPALLRSFATVFPEAKPQVQVKLSNDLLTELLQGRLDLAVVAGEPDHANSIALWSEPLVWVAGSIPGKPVASPLPLVSLPDPCFYRRMAVQTLSAAGLRWSEACLSTTMVGVRASVLAGLGVTVMGQTEVNDGLRIIGAEARLPRLPAAEIVIYYRSKEFEHVAQALAGHVRKSNA
jgi:DNA-binding transcriptional LysR family regulator